MNTYYVRAFTSATAATADHAIAQLWNPSSTRRIELVEFGIFKAGAGAANDSIKINRTTTKGTGAADVTPDADNAGQADSVPPSGALLVQGAFSAQPTLATPPLLGWVAPAVAGAGIIMPIPRKIVIPPGTGVAITQRAATAWPTSEVYFVFED